MTLNTVLTQDYFYLRQRIPIFIYIFYIHFKDSDDPTIAPMIRMALTIIGGVTAYAFIGFIIDTYLIHFSTGPKNPFYRFFPLNWSYYGMLNWGIFFIVFYYLSHTTINHKLHAFTLATLATVGGGWLYEIPFFHPIQMFIHNYALYYLDGQLICLILLAYELKKLKFKPTKLTLATFILFLTFSTLLYADKFYFIQTPWLYRLPASLFLLSLPGGIHN